MVFLPSVIDCRSVVVLMFIKFIALLLMISDMIEPPISATISPCHDSPITTLTFTRSLWSVSIPRRFVQNPLQTLEYSRPASTLRPERWKTYAPLDRLNPTLIVRSTLRSISSFDCILNPSIIFSFSHCCLLFFPTTDCSKSFHIATITWSLSFWSCSHVWPTQDPKTTISSWEEENQQPWNPTCARAASRSNCCTCTFTDRHVLPHLLCGSCHESLWAFSRASITNLLESICCRRLLCMATVSLACCSSLVTIRTSPFDCCPSCTKIWSYHPWTSTAPPWLMYNISIVFMSSSLPWCIRR